MLEVHIDWLQELCQRRNLMYPNISSSSDRVEALCTDNNLEYLDAFWFFRGNPVEESAFKNICQALSVRWDEVIEPKALIP